jgi:methionyl aminopeptidase
MILPRPITVRSDNELELMREAGRVVGRVHQMIREHARSGVTTGELDRRAEEIVREAGATPSFKGYNPHGRPPYPATLCTSIDDVIVHGIPGTRVLREGEILSVDVGACLNGYHGDAALTVPIGEVSDTARRLMEVTKQALEAAISQVQVGNRISDIGHAVQETVEAAGFAVVREFVGHGIGRNLHEPPEIPNFGKPGFGPRIKAGMVFAIEPMVNVGTWKMKELEDGWTAVTADGSLSAHFEHTVAATDDGPIILTVP